MINRIKLAADCLGAAKLMYARRLVNAYEGNVSVKLEKTILITPSGVCKELLNSDDLVEVDIETGATVKCAPGRVASSELKMHLCCYRARDDIRAVAHAHPPYATSFAIRREAIETRGYPEVMILYGRVPVCSYGRPGSDEVNTEVPEALREHDAFLMANHGLATVARTAMDAAYMLEGIESVAKTLHIARLRGGEGDVGEAEARAIETIRLTGR